MNFKQIILFFVTYIFTTFLTDSISVLFIYFKQVSKNLRQKNNYKENMQMPETVNRGFDKHFYFNPKPLLDAEYDILWSILYGIFQISSLLTFLNISLDFRKFLIILELILNNLTNKLIKLCCTFVCFKSWNLIWFNQFIMKFFQLIDFFLLTF